MKRTPTNLFLLSGVILIASCSFNKNVVVKSPDGVNKFVISIERGVSAPNIASFYLEVGNKKVLLPSSLELDLKENPLKKNLNIIRTESISYDKTWIPEQDGIDSVIITREKINFNFASNHFAWSAARAQAQYSKVPLSKIEKGCERPLVIEVDTNLVIALAEAKLVDYARMKFNPDTTRNYNVITYLDSPVNKSLPFRSPWRVVMIGKNTGDLLEKNYLLLNLNDPCEINDVSWIKPGKVLCEVTLTTAGARADIDFTSKRAMIGS